MAIPDYESIMLPLLQIAEEAKGEDVHLATIVGKLADFYKLTEDERRELLPSGGTFKFSSRTSWARTYLQKAGLLVATKRGYFKITERGLEVLKKKPAKITAKYLSQFTEFQEFQGKKKVDKNSEIKAEETPVESIAAHYEQLRQTLATELLQKVKECTPQFFERLVVTLLVKMGYGGSLKEAAGQVVGKSGDGGIDGIINEDKLGLDKIYIQAKKWTDKPVGSPDIDQFAGALSKRKASKGIFITTSNFTKDALASVREYTSRIILIDGMQLAEYMIDHGVGVSITSVYELKKMDSDFFDDEL